MTHPYIPVTYEDLKKWLREECNINHEDYPNQILDFAGFPYWRCTNWKELEEALGKCTVPTIGDVMFSSKNGLEMVQVYDDFIHNNINYRWDLIENNTSKQTITGEKE